MSDKEIIDKIRSLAEIFEDLKNKEIHVLNKYGLLAYVDESESSELWWQEDGTCVEVFKTNLPIVLKAARLPHFDIEL